MPTIRDLDTAAVATSVRIVDEVSPDQLDRPTPCADWDLRALLAHMTAQHLGFAAAAEGLGGDPEVWSVPSNPAADPVLGYREASAQVIGAFAVADLDADRFELHELGGSFPAATAIGFHFIDYLVHAWDVGRAIGLDVIPGDALLPTALTITERVPTGESRTRPGAAFGPAVEGPDEDTWPRILRLLGRSPDWPDRA